MPDPTTPASPGAPMPPIKPSNSTIGSAVGGMAAVFLFLALKQFHIEVDAVSASVISGGMAALVGYFFNGGKAADTE